jgi:hypothetical protein
MTMDCKQQCRWGFPAKIYDGPVMTTVEAAKLKLKRAARNSPEADRLKNLLASQEVLCWTCGKRCSKGEAAELSRIAQGSAAE